MRRLVIERLEGRELLSAATVAAPFSASSLVGLPSQPAFSYTLSAPGQVSLAIYDSQADLVRPMLYGQPQQPGTYSITWDGLDRYGQPVPEGNYQWRLVQSDGFTRTQLANVGVQQTPWPGNH